MADEPLLGKGIEGLLASWETVSRQVRDLDRLLSGLARRDPVCRDILMTAPGVGAITALAFKSVIDDPTRFRRGEEVGAYLGLAPRRHQSGDTDRMGCISRCGDSMLRGYLFEAATVAMMRVKRDNAPATWAKGVAKRSGANKARVALARKLAVTLFAMWRKNQPFRWSAARPEPLAMAA